MKTNLKNMDCKIFNGKLYVLEIDCRANVSAALASKKPLVAALEGLLEVITNDELIPESVSYMKQARAALNRPKES